MATPRSSLTPCLQESGPAGSFKAASGAEKSVFRPLRRRRGSGFTFKAARGLLGRLAGWRRWDPLPAVGPSETGREPEPEPEQGPEREAQVRADRLGRERGSGWA